MASKATCLATKQSVSSQFKVILQAIAADFRVAFANIAIGNPTIGY